MQELEKILEEIELEKKRASLSPDCSNEHAVTEIILLEKIEKIIRKHMNDGQRKDTFEFDFSGVKSFDCQCGRHYVNTAVDGWIPVDNPPKKDYTAVLAVDKEGYHCVAVYDKEHGFRTNDIGADIDNIVSYSLLEPYRPERSDNHDGE